MRREFAILSLVLFVISMSLLVSIIAHVYYIPSTSIRYLAQIYLNTTFNVLNRNFTVNSPEAVTAIVWDYRGLDTVFETTVFYLAIIGSIALARGIIKFSKPKEELGLSIIIKTISRLTTPMIVAVAVSIALHGHLTPGGGFQGGSTAAVAPLILIIAFSQYFLVERGVSKDLMLILRSLGLLVIGIVAVIAYFIGVFNNTFAYVMQNQAKSVSPVSLPTYFGDQLVSGTLWFFNLAEFLAVMAGFTIVILLIVIPERAFRGGEK